jgi:tetratricopeptide (TPR) repeat protein
MGDTQRAIAEFSHAVELQPNADNFIQRGATYQLLGEHEKALLDLTEAVHLDPEDAEVYFARAASERALGQMKKAQEDHAMGRYLDSK